MPKPTKVVKDAKIDVRVPKRTRRQADKLAAKAHLPLSTWIQLLIEKEHESQA